LTTQHQWIPPPPSQHALNEIKEKKKKKKRKGKKMKTKNPLHPNHSIGTNIHSINRESKVIGIQ
jgi:hypothetical protein